MVGIHLPSDVHFFAAQVQALRAGVKVLYTTGYASVPASLLDAVSQPPPIVAKPYTRSALLRHIGALLLAGGEPVA